MDEVTSISDTGPMTVPPNVSVMRGEIVVDRFSMTADAAESLANELLRAVAAARSGVSMPALPLP